jgi:MraZ protein
MIIFTSAYEHTIDAKNRLAIPAQFREKIDPKRDGHRLYLVPGTRPNTLWIYTEKHFEAITEQFGTGMVRDQNIVEFEQEAFPDICEVEPDSQGRIVIPERVLQSAGLGSEVVVCGVRDHMEVWRRDEWE